MNRYIRVSFGFVVGITTLVIVTRASDSASPSTSKGLVGQVEELMGRVAKAEERANVAEKAFADLKAQVAEQRKFAEGHFEAHAKALATAQGRADKAHARINQLKLGIAATSESPGFVCGNEHVEAKDNLKFMYGSRDGTSCGVPNVNFYKELKLDVPSE